MQLMTSVLALALAAPAAAATAAAGTIRSGTFWHDTDGNVIDAHGAGMLLHEGTYHWYGSRRTVNATGTQMDGGIVLYTSSDLYTWKFESVVLQPFNCTSNSTAAASASASATSADHGEVTGRAGESERERARTYPPPSCSNGNGLDLERPKVVQCGGPDSGGKFVMWVRGTGYGNTPQLLGVLEADAPTGPFRFVSNATGSDDPFHTIAPGVKNYPPGYQFADATLFQDPATFKTYVYWRTRMTKGLDGATGFRAMELTADCRGVVPGSDMRVTATANREGPAAFLHEGTYYLYVSGTMGWSPTAMYVYAASSPLGNFSGSSQDEHYWHAWSKGTGGASGAAKNFSSWNGTWTVSSGFLLVGAPWGNQSRDGNGGSDGVQLTFGAAQSLCAGSDTCAGFTFIDYDAAPASSKPLTVTFKRVVQLYPEKEVGLQPPPIPVPGQPGNVAPAQPGAWAFDSQSTYILPNPTFTKGSKLAPFIYMGDRWNYTDAFGTSVATYVWLPLFVHPTNPRLVRVLWRDEWRLDDASMYPFAE